MRLPFFTLAILVAFANIALSQELCTGILSYGAVDVTKESRENAIAASVYSQHCQGSSYSRSSATNIGIDAVVKAIPIKFSFGGSSNEEKMDNFCKTYDSRRAEFFSETIDSSKVVREALQAFNDCIGLSQKEIYFYPDVGKTLVNVAIGRGSKDVKLTGVAFDPSLLDCSLSPTQGEGSSIKVPDDGVAGGVGIFEVSHVIGEKRSTLICKRKPAKGSNGEAIYGEAELLLVTDLGNLKLKIPEDRKLADVWAADIDQKLIALGTEIGAQSKRKMVCRTWESSVGPARYPQITANIPDDVKSYYVRTGGGCRINYYPETPHNGPVMVNRPTEDGYGWNCIAGDPPFTPLDLTLTAYVVGCTLSN